MFEKSKHEGRLLNVRPAKGEPDGVVEGIDADKVTAAMKRLGQSSSMQESWESYPNWKPQFLPELVITEPETPAQTEVDTQGQ